MQEEGRNYWQTDQPDQGAANDFVPPDSSPTEPEMQPISWEASEYIHHQKDVLWFFGLIVIAALLVALSVFLVRSWTFTALVVVMAIAVVVFALRPPRTLRYTISSQGLKIDEKIYSYHDFKAFGVLEEGPLYSIVLLPVKRFMPSVNIYFPQEYGEEIVDHLGNVLPMEDLQLDMIDTLVRKLRF